MHEVGYEVESPLRDNLWLNRTHTMYATDPIDAINKAKSYLKKEENNEIE
jgi:hypothetical protein